MSTPHWAELVHWEAVRKAAELIGSADCSVILELADRLAKLEAQRETEKAAILEIHEKLDRLKILHESNWSRIVKLEEANSSAGLTGSNHPAPPDSSPPAGGLVEMVVAAMGQPTLHTFDHFARAAILACADWVEERHHADHQLVHTAWEAARWLHEEVQRG